MGEQPGAAADLVALADQVETEHGPAAIGGRQGGRQHPKQRALAGTVGAPQQHDLAAPDHQADPDDRRLGADPQGNTRGTPVSEIPGAVSVFTRGVGAGSATGPPLPSYQQCSLMIGT